MPARLLCAVLFALVVFPGCRLPAHPPSAPESTSTSEPEPQTVLAVRGRSTWGARDLDPCRADPMGRITRITVHHTGEPDGIASLTEEEAAARMRSYQASHMDAGGGDARGWADVGYHFVIDPAGRVWEARELAWKGAHAGNGEANRGNVGISVMGNFDVQEFDGPRRAALTDLLTGLRARFGIPLNEVHTHNEIRTAHGLGGTACPGKRLARFLVGLRAR